MDEKVESLSFFNMFGKRGVFRCYKKESGPPFDLPD